MFLPGVFETNIVTDKSSTDSTPIEPTTPVTPTVPVEISPTFKFRTSISLNADGSNKISEFHTGITYKNIHDRLTKLRELHGYTGQYLTYLNTLHLDTISRLSVITKPNERFYLWLEFDMIEDNSVSVTTESYYVMEDDRTTRLNHTTTGTVLKSYQFRDKHFNLQVFDQISGGTQTLDGKPVNVMFSNPYFRVADTSFKTAFTALNYDNVNHSYAVSEIPDSLREKDYKLTTTKKILIGRFDGNFNNVLPTHVLIKTKVGNLTEHHVVYIPGTRPDATHPYIEVPNIQYAYSTREAQRMYGLRHTEFFNIRNKVNEQLVLTDANTKTIDIYCNVPLVAGFTDYLIAFQEPVGKWTLSKITETGKQLANQRQGEVTGIYSYINDKNSESKEIWHVRMMKPGNQYLCTISAGDDPATNTEEMIMPWFMLGVLPIGDNHPRLYWKRS